MPIQDLRFISSNRFKNIEVREILGRFGVTVLPVEMRIMELQTENAQLLVRDKALRAFERVHRPLLVEHTGLFLNYLNGLPGGLRNL